MNAGLESKSVVKKVHTALFWPLRIFRDFCALIGFFAIASALGIGLFVVSFLNELPQLDRIKFAGVKQLAQIKIQATLEDKSKRYRWVELNEVNRDFLFAIVLAEDAEFFEHEGIAFDSMLNSFADNIRNRKIESGGSTITQQTVKNVFLTNEKSFSRKLKEILIARDLEEKLSKNEILEIYLNLAEFGPDVVGVNAASNRYFQKPPSEVSAAEGAFLALLLPSPRRYHYSLIENKNLTRAHRNKIRRILGDMLHNEYISLKQYNAYLRYDFFDSVKNAPLKRRTQFERGVASKKK
jgi:monofunctional biosynthetic peptidoglycan transglycosylase